MWALNLQIRDLQEWKSEIKKEALLSSLSVFDNLQVMLCAWQIKKTTVKKRTGNLDTHYVEGRKLGLFELFILWFRYDLCPLRELESSQSLQIQGVFL